MLKRVRCGRQRQLLHRFDFSMKTQKRGPIAAFILRVLLTYISSPYYAEYAAISHCNMIPGESITQYYYDCFSLTYVSLILVQFGKVEC